MRTSVRGRAILPVALVTSLALTGLTACGKSAKGGATTCKEYLAMSSAEQTDAVKAFLESNGKKPANGEITLNRLSALAYCKTAGRDSDPISKING